MRKASYATCLHEIKELSPFIRGRYRTPYHDNPYHYLGKAL